LNSSGGDMTGEVPSTEDLSVDLPPDDNNGWLGIMWMLLAMIPLSIGGGILRPAINSLITKRVEHQEVGGMLGISSSFSSAANALAPLIGGIMFQALGPRSPFLAGGIVMGILLLIAVRAIKPGREDNVAAGMARGGGH
jgi:MFS family permease